MSYLYYFVPDVDVVNQRAGSLNVEMIKQLDLEPIFKDRMKVPDETIYFRSEGPDGQPGMLLYPRPPLQRDDLPALSVISEGESQKWFDCGGYWIGVETLKNQDVEFTAEYFAKSVMCAGLPVEDELGRAWRIPVVYTGDKARYCLPMQNTFGLDGSFSSTRRPQDEELWELCSGFADFLSERVPLDKVNPEQMIRGVIKLLGVNYHIGVREIAVLQQVGQAPLSDRWNTAVMGSSIDWQLNRDHADEKKIPESVSA